MNQHYTFHVSYYDCLTGEEESKDSVRNSNRQLLEAVYVSEGEEIPFTEESFLMKTMYPGAAIGLGANHDAGGSTEIDFANKKDAVKGGITLDYTTGVPYWPGSSVKGTIRSAFETKVKGNYLVKEMLEEHFGEEMTLELYNELMEEIFGSGLGAKSRKGNIGAKQRGEDSFLDALVVKPNPRGRILGDDYITSHKLTKKDRIGLDEPKPVQFFKILPEVSFLFRFRLKDSIVYPGLTKEQKMELYQAILETTGIGAKTNTGYGMVHCVEGSSACWKELIPSVSGDGR